MKLGNYEWDPEANLIAEGSFAEVFRARDNNTAGRIVALKIYKEAVAKGNSGSSGQKKYTLENEFHKVDRLSHTNIISYYGLDYIHSKDGLGRDVSYPALIMEYAEGGTLTDFIKTNADGATRDKLIRDIIHGLGYLHSEGILHRDLKPGNILITKNRRGKPVAKITDFGISRDILTDRTVQQSYTEGVGTPHYMAPEQFAKIKYGLNGELSNRTDLWSLGVIIYKIVTGRLPFGEGLMDYELIREAILEAKVDMEAVPESYRNTIKMCLRPHAIDRVKDAESFLVNYSTNPSPYLPESTTANEIASAITERNPDPVPLIPNIVVANLPLSVQKLVDDMVYVEGGTFTMGCTPDQGGDCDEDEKPIHQVTLSSYSIGKYEVTQAQWLAVTGNNPSVFRGCDDCPVEQVSWDDVQVFLSKLNALTGKKYRLPIEAEWEYAARGGNKSRGYKYPGSNDINLVAWHGDNSGRKTHHVGRKAPNELGLYDMGGNVREWCQDWYRASFGSAKAEHPGGPAKVVRGGSWYLTPRYSRVSFRDFNTPGYFSYYLGLRLILDT